MFFWSLNYWINTYGFIQRDIASSRHEVIHDSSLDYVSCIFPLGNFIKFSRFQGIQEISLLKINNSSIQAIEEVYARSLIAFQHSRSLLIYFKIICCIIYFYPLKIYIHLHSFLRKISSTFIYEGFGFTLISFPRVFEVESSLLHLHTWLHSKFYTTSC